jgi:hypothetical protein
MPIDESQLNISGKQLEGRSGHIEGAQLRSIVSASGGHRASDRQAALWVFSRKPRGDRPVAPENSR